MSEAAKIAFFVVVITLLLRRGGAAEALPPNPHGRSRGMRNNNPGNIKISRSQWRGKVDEGRNTDGVFEQFVTVEYGIRAAILLLKNYYFEHGRDTIRKIIYRWAPPSENSTESYVWSVSDCSGIGHNSILEWGPDQIAPILHCMFIHENGANVAVPSVQKIRQVWLTIL